MEFVHGEFKTVKVLDFAFLSSDDFKVTFMLHRQTSISKVLSAGQTNKHPNLSGMTQTKSEDAMNRKVGKGRGGKESEAEDHHKQIRILQPKMSFTQGNIYAINCDFPLLTSTISENMPLKSYCFLPR